MSGFLVSLIYQILPMTLNEYAVQLAEPHDRQFDHPYLAMIKDRIIIKIGRMLRNSLEKNPKDRTFYRMEPLILPLHSTTLGCGPDACTVMETGKIPTPLRSNGILFDFVGSADGSTAFTEAALGMDTYINSTKYASRRTKYRWLGDRLQVLSNMIPKIMVQAIWTDPRVVAKLRCDDEKCDVDDLPFEMTDDIMELVMTYVAEDLRKSAGDPLDTTVKMDNGETVQR